MRILGQVSADGPGRFYNPVKHRRDHLVHQPKCLNGVSPQTELKINEITSILSLGATAMTSGTTSCSFMADTSLEDAYRRLLEAPNRGAIERAIWPDRRALLMADFTSNAIYRNEKWLGASVKCVCRITQQFLN